MDPAIQIGSRIACEDENGTVMYIGEIDSYEGIWLGIEWDNPSRGKHSGCYNNKNYFVTRMPNSGSFIRIKKAKTGKSCPDAIKERYGQNVDLEPTKMIHHLPQNVGKKRLVEMIGFQKVIGKQSQFHKLTDIVVSTMLVNNSGAPGELKELIPNVSSLDLSKNLLTSWEDVAAIVEQLPSLKFLIVSYNRLKIPDSPENFQQSFTVLQSVVLNSMTYTWKEIISCAMMWPYVQHLYLCGNEISYIEEPRYPLFCQLRYLNLEGNPIGSWELVCKLGQLSNLEELYLDSIKLESIRFPEVPPWEKTDLFPNLQSLSIGNNNLREWQDIGELNKLTKLRDLKIINNPIIASVSVETARQLLIAKISGLEKVNKTELERSERRGAEIDYIKRYHKDWIASGGNKDVTITKPSREFLDQHPTYLSLLQKHGCAEESEVATENSLLKGNLISVEIFSTLMPNKPPVIKKLPASMSICRVKALIQRIFNVVNRDVQLTSLNAKGLETEIDNDMRQLSFYSISNGDKIAVKW